MTPHRDTDEAALEPFFAAARAGVEAPRLSLLSAIIADAARVQAERPPAPAPAAPPGPPAAARRAPAPRRLAPIGGWRGLAALAACAALGFWLGIAGEVSIGGGAAWSGLDSAESSVDQVGAFYDLALAEG